MRPAFQPPQATPFVIPPELLALAAERESALAAERESAPPPPPAAPSAESAPPPSRPPPSAPPAPTIAVDRSDPKILRFVKVAEALRQTSGALASILERAHIVDATETVVRIALDPRGFEKDQISAPAAREAIQSAVASALGDGAIFEVIDLAPGAPKLSLSVAIESVRREKVAELDKIARSHPLVVAAMRELGAEIRDVRLPEVDVSGAFAAPPA